MEDLKKIQEFFSKPLEENSRLRKQFILLETAEIKYTESYGTGIKAPGVLHQVNEGVFFGAEDAYIIVLPGGTFYVDEDKEEAIPIWPLKDQSQELHKALHPTPFAPEFKVWKDWIKRPNVLDENALGFNDSRLSSDQHRDLDYAVRGDSAYTFGNDPYADDQLRYKYAVKMGFLNEAKKLTYNDFVRMVRDDMMAGAAPDERPSEKLVGKRAKAYYNDYLQGASVDDLFEYNTGIYYDPAKERNAIKAKKSTETGLQKLKDFIKKVMKEDLADFEEKDVDYDELYSDYLYKLVKEVAAQKGFSKYLKSKDNPKGETDGLTPQTLNKILMNVIKDLDELKQLGEGMIEEELCEKGKAYRKKRMAAGEKSSAYLNGRAVKVCKGQMKG